MESCLEGEKQGQQKTTYDAILVASVDGKSCAEPLKAVKEYLTLSHVTEDVKTINKTVNEKKNLATVQRR